MTSKTWSCPENQGPFGLDLEASPKGHQREQWGSAPAESWRIGHHLCNSIPSSAREQLPFFLVLHWLGGDRKELDLPFSSSPQLTFVS